MDLDMISVPSAMLLFYDFMSYTDVCMCECM